MKIAICMTGHMRTYDICYQYIEDIVKNNDVDFFIHTWSFLNYDNKVEIDYNKIQNLYNPKSLTVENFDSNQNLNFFNVNLHNLLRQVPEPSVHNPVSIYHQLRKIKCCFDLIPDPQIYDLIFRIRPDNKWSVNFSEINPQKLNVEIFPWKDYFNIKYPDGFCRDNTIIGPPNLMMYYASCFLKLPEYTKFLPIHPELLVGYHIKDIINYVDLGGITDIRLPS